MWTPAPPQSRLLKPGNLPKVDSEPTAKRGLANTDDLEPPASNLGWKQPANSSLGTTAQPTSAGTHLA
ncbi:hypothetical protein E2C01_022659 [Portunus trituberculatus]|uniref:Uncharacterized protein n=1 Tax=Portunus trituberculatus TaxID=210409 RepID=A0A5B7E7P5_PORTR|nr:hypothetical protein [Portunus trituberculatus]